MSNNEDSPKAQAPDEPAPFDLGAKLAQRLREHTATRDRTQRRLDQENLQLQHLTKSAPKRPRDAKNVLLQKAKQLERERTTRSLPLAQEKALIRQIDAAKKSIRIHDQADQHQGLIRRKKAELESSRAALRTINVTVSEIETALSKVELGKKLGCLPSEVVTKEVGCPMDKMNWAIGKEGANLKAIKADVLVLIEVDKIRAKFVLRGSQFAVDEAVLRLENFTKAVDVEITPSGDLISYLLSQHSPILNRIKIENPEVVIDLLSSKINMRGHPDKVQKAKQEIGAVQVFTKSRLLVGKEISIVVRHLDSINEEHGVVMDLSKKDGEKTTLRIIGPSDKVDAGLAAVDKMLFESEEIEESIAVDPLLKTELLNKSGANIHEFQRSLSSAVEAVHPEAGGVFLTFERNGSNENGSNDRTQKLLLRCNRCVMDRAKKMVTKKVKEFESNVISIDVSEEFISAIIGKGGSTISDLRKEGKGALVETDAISNGSVKVYSSDVATRDAIRQKIEQIIAENQTGSIPIEKKSIGLVLGDPGKDVRKACAELGCTLNVNDDDTKLVIKGTNEKIEQASKLLKDFLAKNHVDELEVAVDDQPLFFMGGSGSILHQLEAKHHVKASLRKGKNVLYVRGEAGEVSAALHDVKCFLNGGDGLAVCKFKVNGKAKGGVIGKGGGNISKLEEEFKGIRIHIPKDDDTISIRGPEDLVEQCRIRLVTTIATTRVVENIDMDISQLEKLSKSDAIKQISRFTNTQITLNESSIRVRGISDDINCAKANIEELLTGVYYGFIYLEAPQFSRVKSAVTKDPSHFQRIQASTGADVNLESDAIRISGKKSNVKKAKLSLSTGFLSFMLPRQFQTVKIDHNMLKSMGDPERLAQLAAESGVSISLDRDINSILIRSDQPDNCDKALKIAKSMIVECEKLIAVMKFDSSDSWLLSVIVGKGGATIKKLEKETGCSFDINRDEKKVVILAQSEKVRVRGQKGLDDIIYQARKECIFIYLPESAMPAFIGKGGTGIKKLAADNEVQIERPKNRPSTICIKGKENCVASARNAVLSWVKAWEASHIGITIDLDERSLPYFVGERGETVRSLEKETGCTIDVNRQQSTVAVKYSDDAKRDSALKKIQAIIDGEPDKAAVEDAAEAELNGEQTQNDTATTESYAETNSSSDAPEHHSDSEEIAEQAAVEANLADELATTDTELTEEPVAAETELTEESAATETELPEKHAENAKTESEVETDASPPALEPPSPSKVILGIADTLYQSEEPVEEKEENGLNPAIHGTEEGRQLYQWLLTGHVGDAIVDIIHPASDTESSVDGDDETDDDSDRIVMKKDEKGEEVIYYQSESGFSVRLPRE